MTSINYHWTNNASAKCELKIFDLLIWRKRYFKLHLNSETGYHWTNNARALRELKIFDLLILKRDISHINWIYEHDKFITKQIMRARSASLIFLIYWSGKRVFQALFEFISGDIIKSIIQYGFKVIKTVNNSLGPLVKHKFCAPLSLRWIMRPQSNMNLAPLPHVKHEFGATGQHQIGDQKIEHQFGAPPPVEH